MRALLAVLLVMTGAGERWKPLHEEGATWTRSFTRESRTEVIDAYVRANGEEKHVENPGIISEERSALRVEERVLGVKAGELLGLERRYLEMPRMLRATQPGKDGKPLSRELKETGALQGRSVRFERASPDAAFECTLVDKDGPREELARLDVDMGAFGVLPESAPEEGASWKVPAERLRIALLRPGGRPRWPLPAGAPPAEERLADGLWDSMKGELEARYAERVVRDGKAFARVELKGSIELSAQAQREEGESGAERYQRSGKGELAGVLWWSLEAGYTESFELELKLKLSATEWGQVKTKGEPMPVERELISVQTEKLAYRTEAPGK